MPLYENVFIARQDISGAQVDAIADGFVQLIADNGGELKKREYWGLRNLAYRMRKNRKGHYVLMNLEAPPAAIAELERTMRINEDVLRYLTIRVDAHEEGPSAVMQNRGSRDDRGRRGDRDRYGDGREGREGRDGRENRDGRDGERAERPVPERAVPERAAPEPAAPEPAAPEPAATEPAAVPAPPTPEPVEP
jgi:small subunit ribosomal protein S6